MAGFEYDRLTQSSRLVVDAARRNAEATDCSAIHLLHLVEALLEVRDSVSYRLLKECGLDFAASLGQLRLSEAYGKSCESQVLGEELGFSARTLNMLGSAGDEAKRNGDWAIGPEHLLLALLSSEEPEVKIGLNQFNITYSRIQNDLQTLLGRVEHVPYDPENAFAGRIADSPVWQAEVARNHPVLEGIRQSASQSGRKALISTVRRATDADPMNYALRNSCAEILREFEAFHEAVFHLGIAVALDPENPIAYRRMARNFMFMGQEGLARHILHLSWPFFQKGASQDFTTHLEENRAFWFDLIGN